MNIDLIVDQNHNYRQAVQAAYEKAKSEGSVDEVTEKCCQLVINHPYPAAVYHEADMKQVFTPSGDGGVFYKEWTPREIYEQARINGRKNYAESLAKEMHSAGEDFKKELIASGSSLGDKLVSFMVDERGMLKAISPLKQLSSDEVSLISRLANENKEFKALAMEYIRVLASLVGSTIEGLGAEYARHFSHSS